MKCQHCGINFDDSERVCPICGERAGSRGRLSKKTSVFRTESHTESKRAQKTIINGKEKKSSVEEKTKKGIIGVVVIAILSQVLPVLFNVVIDRIEYGGVGEVYPSEEAPVPDYSYMTMHDIIGDQAAAALSDGAILYLHANEEGEYTLQVDGDWQFFEHGYAYFDGWDRYEYGEELTYAEMLPEDEYTDYLIGFQLDSFEQAGQERDLDAHTENGVMQLVAHVSNQTGDIILNDYYGDADFLFGDEQFILVIPLDEEEFDIGDVQDI